MKWIGDHICLQHSSQWLTWAPRSKLSRFATVCSFGLSYPLVRRSTAAGLSAARKRPYHRALGTSVRKTYTNTLTHTYITQRRQRRGRWRRRHWRHCTGCVNWKLTCNQRRRGRSSNVIARRWPITGFVCAQLHMSHDVQECPRKRTHTNKSQRQLRHAIK